jgi:hypothetical protein
MWRRHATGSRLRSIAIITAQLGEPGQQSDLPRAADKPTPAQHQRAPARHHTTVDLVHPSHATTLIPDVDS